jgi:hypothetical protein
MLFLDRSWVFVRLGLLLVVLCSAAAAGRAQDSASVFLLVDESGSMKRDREGWRKEAARLLVYGLPNGSTIAASGFGDPEKPITLVPILLNDTAEGTRNRQALAARMESLGDADQKTDIYGALRAVLARIAEIDPDTRAAKPPYVIMLSDFEPSPDPGDQVRKSVCDDMKQTGAHLLAVGFGKVHRPTIGFLQSCGDTTVWGPVENPSSLMGVFWKIQRRISRALPMEQRTIEAGERVSFRLPSWAQQGFLLTWTRNIGGGAPVWKGDVEKTVQATGKSFRLARWTSSPIGGIDFTCTVPVELSVVAAGPIEVQASFDPPMPWLPKEPVRISAKLISSATGAAVTDWISTAATEASGKWEIGSEVTPLVVNPNNDAVEGSSSAPATETSSTGVVEMSVGGASWTRNYKGHVVRSPFTIGNSYRAHRLFEWQRLTVPLESAFGDRDFTADVRPPAGFLANPQTIGFTKFTRSQSVSLQRSSAPSSLFVRVFGGLASAVRRVPETTTAEIVFDIKPSTGLKRTDVARLTVELLPYPQWSLRTGAALVLGAPIFLIVMAVVGPKFPRGFLKPCDLNGRPIGAGEMIELHKYRKRLRLDRWGLRNAALRTTYGKRIFVILGPGARLLKMSDGYRSSSAVSMLTCTLEVGDIVAAEDGGKTAAYIFD